MGIINDLIEKVNKLTLDTSLLYQRFGREVSGGQKEETFWAKLTAVDASGNYSWTKQYFTTAGAFTDHPDGRTGTPTSFPAKENNGAVIATFPVYAKLTRRLELTTTAQVIYGFDATAGATGAELKGLTFTSDTDSTADSDPGNGLMKWNNATQSSATQLYFDNLTADAVTSATFFASLGSTGFIYLQQYDDARNWQLWKWTALPTAGAGYYKFTVTLQGASATGIADNKTVYTDFNCLSDPAAAGANTELKGFTFTSDTDSTADSDPGAGLFKWNNATQGSATVLYFDNQTADGVDAATFFASCVSAGFIYLQQSDDSTKWQKWKWTVIPTAGAGYYKFTVTLQANGGSIADAKTVYTKFVSLPTWVTCTNAEDNASADTTLSSDDTWTNITGVSMTPPTVGTYLYWLKVRCLGQVVTPPGYIELRLYDGTAALATSQTLGLRVDLAATDVECTTTVLAIGGAGATITGQARRLSGPTWTTATIVSGGAYFTSSGYIKLCDVAPVA